MQWFRFFYKIRLVVTPTILIVLVASCQSNREVVVTGNAMGTTWQTKLITPIQANWQDQIAEKIEQMEALMSNYRDNSQVSQFNQLAVGATMTIAFDVFQVLQYAQNLAIDSNGYFNVTIGRAIDQWGFGAADATKNTTDDAWLIPTNSWLQYQLSQSSNGQYSIKKLANINIDLSALAKGYTVDVVATLLLNEGVEHFLISIGGELRASGLNAKNKPWLVAVENANNGIATKVQLDNTAIATSGNYRNYTEENGQIIGHILDGRNAKPIVTSSLVATIIAKNCMQADAMATVLMAMPTTVAIAFANDNQLNYLLQYLDNDDVKFSNSLAFQNVMQQ